MPPRSPIRIKAGPTGWVWVELPYTPERLQKIRTIPERKWLESHHCWAIPRTKRTLERLQALFSGDQIIIDSQLKGKKQNPKGWQPAIRVAPGPATDIVRTFTHILKQKAYSPHTIKIYTFHTRRFFKKMPHTATDLQPQDIRQYLNQLEIQDNATETYLNQATRALKALCRLALHKSPEFLKTAFPSRRPKSLS